MPGPTTPSGDDTDLKLPGLPKNVATPAVGQEGPQIRARLEHDGEHAATSAPRSNSSNGRHDAASAALQIATSFDSVTDSSEFHLTTAPLHALQISSSSTRDPINKSNRILRAMDDDDAAENFGAAEDYEILPDDDDGAGDIGTSRSKEASAQTPKSSALELPTSPSTRKKPHAAKNTILKSKNAIVPQTTPPCSPPSSRPSSPITPSRKSKFHSTSRSSTSRQSPRQKVSWKQQLLHHHYHSPRQQQQQQQDGDDSSRTSPEQPPRDGKTNKFWPFPSDVAAKSPFRAFRARAMAAYRGKDTDETAVASGSAGPSVDGATLAGEEWAHDEGSSSDDYSIGIGDGDSFTSYEDDDDDDDDDDDVAQSSLLEMDKSDSVMDQFIDFLSMSYMPNSFLDLPPDVYDYLDPDLIQNISEQNASTFAYEHHLFAKGVLQLLAERDLVGVEGDIHDMSNVIKMGPLKKRSSRGLWSVKYIEIRRGNLSYFADESSSTDSDTRKTIHLRKRTCQCNIATKDGNNNSNSSNSNSSSSNSNNFVFELMVEGGRMTRWMAQSEEERQGWIRAINQAMIGDTEGSQDAPVDISLYETAIETYKSVQMALQQVPTRGDYMDAVDRLLYQKSLSSSLSPAEAATALQIPMQWVRNEIIQKEDSKADATTSPRERVKSTISETLKNISRTSVIINGRLIEANTMYSAERVIGTLSRCILEFDKVDNKTENLQDTKSVKQAEDDTFMTEVEAVSYARSILVGVLHSVHGGDVTAAVQRLVENELLASVQLESSEPLHVDVTFAGDDFSEREQMQYDLSGWLHTRRSWGKVWKKRFFVVSEGVLSFFEQAEPRPSGLRGQIVLRKSISSSVDDEIIQVKTDEEERLLRFEDRGTFVKWKTFLERVSDPESKSTSATKPRTRTTLPGNVTPLKTATDTGVKVGKRAIKVMKGAKHAGMKKIKNARGMIAPWINGGRKGGGSVQSSTQAMLMESTRGMPSTPNQKREPTVQAVVELNSVYKVMSVASEQQIPEPLLMIRAKLYQAFLFSGGTNGRMSSGDELIEMEFLGLDEGTDHEFLESPTPAAQS